MKQSQRGFAAVLLIVMIAMAAVAALTTNLWGGGGDANLAQQKITREALRQAKEALLAYVEVGNATGYTTALQGNSGGAPNALAEGRLPCPDLNGDGIELNDCGIGAAGAGRHALGLLPWATLGVSRIKDGANECLWYAVSGAFKNMTPTYPANADSVGQFSIIQPVKNINVKTGAVTWTERLSAGNASAIAVSPDRVVAVIFAPGAASSTQNRRALASSRECPLPVALAGMPNAELSASRYLESYTGTISANNTTIANANSRKIWGQADENHEKLNDELIWITATEFGNAVSKRTLRLYSAAINAFVYGYYDDVANAYVPGNGYYPNAASSPGGSCVGGRLQGYVPFTCNNISLNLGAQITNDGWNTQTHYAVSENCVQPTPVGQVIRNPPFNRNNVPTIVCRAGNGITVGADTTSVQALLLMRGRQRTGQAACGAFNTMNLCLEDPVNSASVLRGNTLTAPFPATVSPISTYNPITTGSNDLLYLFRQKTQ
jgi:hypothetical protein